MLSHLAPNPQISALLVPLAGTSLHHPRDFKESSISTKWIIFHSSCKCRFNRFPPLHPLRCFTKSWCKQLNHFVFFYGPCVLNKIVLSCLFFHKVLFSLSSMCHRPVRSTLLIVWCCNQQGSSLLQGHLSRGWHALKSAPLAVHLPIWTSYLILLCGGKAEKHTRQFVHDTRPILQRRFHRHDITDTCVMEYLLINKMICREKLKHGGRST